MEKNSILSLMVNQHALIEALFFIFKNGVESKTKRVENAFLDFSWELRKHFFVEEEAIFNYLPWGSASLSGIIKELKKEHVEMLNIAEQMKGNLSGVLSNDLDNLYDILKEHRQTEEKSLYPVMDKRLTASQKEFVALRIRQIPINRPKKIKKYN